MELHEGDIVGNECLPQPARITHEDTPEEHAVHNPFGRWRLTPLGQG